MTQTIEDLSTSFATLVAKTEMSVLGIGRGHSGLAWSDDVAITSACAVRGHDEVEVRLAGGRERTAKVLGGDVASDLAVLRVEGGGLAPITHREDAPARVGELVFALGRPGRAIRASQRIVGLVGKDVPTRRGLVLAEYVEMDRGFPEGFVGGAIVDAKGLLVGLGTDRVIRGADLALTPSFLGPLIDSITATGRPRIGWLGVAVQAVRVPDRHRPEVPHLAGALVTGVESGGPADAAGLVLGDVIVGLDATPIDGPDALLARLRSLPDREVELTLLRSASITKLRATVGVRRS